MGEGNSPKRNGDSSWTISSLVIGYCLEIFPPKIATISSDPASQHAEGKGEVKGKTQQGPNIAITS